MASPFSAQPTPHQQLVLDTLAEVYLEHDRWPAWVWLEEVLEREGLDGWAIVGEMPQEHTYNYGFLWPVRPNRPSPQDQIGLRIAGLRHVSAAAELVSKFCALVGVLGSIRSAISLDPFANERPRATKQEITARLEPPMPPDVRLLGFLSKEPATWMCQVAGDPKGHWEIELSPEIRRFAGVQAVDDYLACLERQLAGDGGASAESVFVSPFTLPAAIDYLDAVWRLRFDSPLIASPGIERSARLAFTVESSEEADSALSALAEVLKGLRIPGIPGLDGHPLQRLVPFLQQHLPSEALPRIEDAVARLNAARGLRAGIQHRGAATEALHAYEALRLRYPVSDWSTAWAQVQGSAAHAFNAIREELQASQ